MFSSLALIDSWGASVAGGMAAQVERCGWREMVRGVTGGSSGRATGVAGGVAGKVIGGGGMVGGGECGRGVGGVDWVAGEMARGKVQQY